VLGGSAVSEQPIMLPTSSKAEFEIQRSRMARRILACVIADAHT
jgi:hypothetical protein